MSACTVFCHSIAVSLFALFCWIAASAWDIWSALSLHLLGHAGEKDINNLSRAIESEMTRVRDLEATIAQTNADLEASIEFEGKRKKFVGKRKKFVPVIAGNCEKTRKKKRNGWALHKEMQGHAMLPLAE